MLIILPPTFFSQKFECYRYEIYGCLGEDFVNVFTVSNALANQQFLRFLNCYLPENMSLTFSWNPTGGPPRFSGFMERAIGR